MSKLLPSEIERLERTSDKNLLLFYLNEIRENRIEEIPRAVRLNLLERGLISRTERRGGGHPLLRRACGDLTTSEFELLVLITKLGEATLVELSEHSDLSISQIQRRVVGTLYRKEFIDRRRNSRHFTYFVKAKLKRGLNLILNGSKNTSYALTEKGRKLVGES